MEKLGYSSAFRINNTVGFAHAIARALPGFLGGAQGFCVYRDSKIVERTNLEMELPQMPPQSGDDAIRIFHKMNSIIWGAAAMEPLFRKPIKYAYQNEYRFVWFSKLAEEQETVNVEVPQALEFCERVVDIPKSTEMEMMFLGTKMSLHSSLEDALNITVTAEQFSNALSLLANKPEEVKSIADQVSSLVSTGATIAEALAKLVGLAGLTS